MSRVIYGLAVLAAATSGCWGSDESCHLSTESSRLVLPVAERCLRGEAMVLGDDGWTSDGVEVELAERDGGHVVALSSGSAARAFALRFEKVSADRILQQGYQSWSFSGAVEIPSEVPLAGDGMPELKAASTGDVADEAEGVSYGSAVLGSDRGEVLVVGAASAEVASTGIAVAGAAGEAELTIVYGAARESLPMRDGVSRSEDIAIFSAADATSGLRSLGDLIAAALPDNARSARRPPGGWFSWNQRFADIDQAYIRSHIDTVSERLAPLGLNLLEIDDGWMPKWGDWYENDGFSDSLETLGGEITDAGLVAGIWFAPFLVDVDSEIAKTIDPQLLVRDEDDNPIEHRYTASTTGYYILDGTNPESMAVATEKIASLRDAGYRFFKFDFLYGGALPGRRKEDVTGVEAFRQGMKLLREAAGEDSIINACGVPIHPVLGLTDSLRIGPDTAFAAIDPSFPLISSAARSYAARHYLFPIVWPDSDQTQVRDPYSAELAQMSAIVAALAGPAYALGDDLQELSEERLAMATAEEILDLAGTDEPAVPVGLLDTPASEVIMSPLLESYTSATYTKAPPPAEFLAVGKSGVRYRITAQWEEPFSLSVTEE